MSRYYTAPSPIQLIRTSILLAVVALPLAGCSMGPVQLSGSSPLPSASGVTVTGTVHGGQSPVVGSTLQIYAAGTTGYGTGATALIPAGSYAPGGAKNCVVSGTQTCTTLPQSDANGNFTITGDYTCPSGSSQVYIVATGGNNGAGNNPALAMMAGLGPCSGASALTVNINEISTVATVWSLQQFMSATYGTQGAFSIGAPSTAYNGVQTAQVGMTNAFSMIANLANISTGTAGPVNTAGASAEADKIDTLANVLSTCINSTLSDSGCPNLFNAVKPSGQTSAPADTIQAALDIALNPANNTTGIFNLAPAAASPFPSPALSAAPNDWTIAVGFFPKVAGTDVVVAPYGVAVDAYGNVWFDNSNNVATDGPFELSPAGALLVAPLHTFTASGNCAAAPCTAAPNTLASSSRTFLKPKGIGIDLNGYVWVPNNADALGTTSGAASVAVLPGSTGAGVASPVTAATATGYYVATSPYDVAVDPNNTVYVVSNTTALSPVGVFPLGSATASNAGAVYQGMGAVSATGLAPYGISIDSNTTAAGAPFVWLGETSGCASTGAVQQFYTSGANAYTATPNSSLASVNTTTCGVTATTVNDQFAATTSGILGTAIDASNNVWMVNSTTAGVTYLVQNQATGAVGSTSTSSVTLSGSPSTMASSQWVAVDGNNAAWVSNGSGNTIGVFTVSTASGSPVITATPSTGIIHNEASTTSTTKVQTTRQLAIDPSGNVWLAQNSSTSGTYVVAVVGAAGPVVTPLVQAVKSKKLGQKP